MAYPRFEEPEQVIVNTGMLIPPTSAGEQVELVKVPNIQSLPPFEPLPNSLEGPVLIKLGDNVSTDEIMPAGEQVLPYRSNIAAISTFVFRAIDASYDERAMRHQPSGSLIVGGRNYGQGSSREHAAMAPRYLGVKAVVAKSFARIHWQNLINFGILPLTFANPDDWHRIAPGDILRLPDVREAIQRGNQVHILNQHKNETYMAEHAMTDRQVQVLLAGSLINLYRARQAERSA
jgi:aconitate hydratase